MQRAVEEVPEPFQTHLRSVAIVVEREPSPHDLEDAEVEPGGELFGLYVGVPLVDRADYHMVLPDRIVIYQGAHERHFAPGDLRREIRRTVMHEVAHHFGIDDDRLREMHMD